MRLFDRNCSYFINVFIITIYCTEEIEVNTMKENKDKKSIAANNFETKLLN